MNRKLMIAGAASILAAAILLPRGEAEFVFDDTPVNPVGTEGGPRRSLNSAEMDQFIRGRAVFDRDFHVSDGLGLPDMNGDSCRGCHFFPDIGGAGLLDTNVSRFGQDDGSGGGFLNLGTGPGNQQIAHKSRSPDDSGRENHDGAANVFEQRQTPSLFGMGLIETVAEADILANEDTADVNQDGVRGRARLVQVDGQTEVGRFGWKANIPMLQDFARDAMGNELGMTTPVNPRGIQITTDNDTTPDPELSQSELDDLTFYMQLLAAPPRGGAGSNPLVMQGESLFGQIGCATCHIPSLPGSEGPVNAYTNLLLHNVHPPGFRGMAEQGAGVGFYRTAPLWGIVRTAPYMHDGSAETIEDAILAHDGEAVLARASFEALTAGERTALLLFLEDL